jgi:hypothetical protein
VLCESCASRLLAAKGTESLGDIVALTEMARDLEP